MTTVFRVVIAAAVVVVVVVVVVVLDAYRPHRPGPKYTNPEKIAIAMSRYVTCVPSYEVWNY